MVATLQTGNRSQPGFTLVEMIVTIGIIIVAAGFIAPAIAAIFQDRRIENAAAIIVSTVNEARNNAVTKKQKYSVVFLKKGVRLYRHPKGEDMGGFVGGLRPINVRDAEHITYDLPCAGCIYEEIPELLQGQVRELPADRWKLEREDYYITLLADGTIDFGLLNDVPSYRFQSDPPSGGDMILHQKGDMRDCFIDIRPTGRVVSKVGEAI